VNFSTGVDKSKESVLPSLNQALANFLTLEDLYLCSELIHYTSLRSAARSFNIDPSLLSKKLKNIETKLNIVAVTKSPSGILFTKEFMEISHKCSELINEIKSLKSISTDSENSFTDTLTIAAPGYLNTLICTNLVSDLEKINPQLKFRFVDVSPIETHELAKKGLVDIILSTSKLDLEKRFQKEPICTFDWAFFLRKGHPLIENPTSEEQFHIVSNIFYDGHKFNTIQLNLEQKNKQFRWGHESQTAANALKIAEGSNHLAYLPILSAYPYLKLDKMACLSNKLLGFPPPQNQVLFMYVEKDRVKKSIMDNCLFSIKATTEGAKNEINLT